MIAGGVHAIIYHKQILHDSPVDLVCCGDGEVVIHNVLKEMSYGQPNWSCVKGLSYKTVSGEIQTASCAPLASYSDDVIENRDIYLDRYPIMKQDTIGYFIASRGCPYSCSFCYNSYLRKAVGTKGYLRRKSATVFLKEIEIALRKADYKSIFFIDDLFTFDKKWLKEFLPLYRKRIGLPFVCTTRANVMDEEVAQLLAQGGCHSASFGIETGNQELRKTILNKNITDEQMMRCGRLLRKYGICVRASSMFCLPNETIEDAFKTIEINIECQVDFAASMLLIPYPETAIAEHMKKHNMISPDYSLYDVPNISYKTSVATIQDKDKITNIHYLSYFFVKYPWLFKRFRWIIHLTWLSPFFYTLFMYSLIERNKRENELSWKQAFIYGWRKKSLLKKTKK